MTRKWKGNFILYQPWVSCNGIPVVQLAVLRIPDFLDIRLIDGNEVVSLKLWATVYPPERFLVLISVRG
jgi:hypothetical protein